MHHEKNLLAFLDQSLQQLVPYEGRILYSRRCLWAWRIHRGEWNAGSWLIRFIEGGEDTFDMRL